MQKILERFRYGVGMRRVILLAALLCGAVGWCEYYDADDYTVHTVWSDEMRVDFRTSFGGRLATGKEMVSFAGDEKLEEGTFSVDGKAQSSKDDYILLDTSKLTNGEHAFLLDDGAQTICRTINVMNNKKGVAIHEGMIEKDETWAANVVHVIRHWTCVCENVTLTIADGAIVKFCEETGLNVIGKLDAEGAIFTSIADDNVGGDTDGENKVVNWDEYEIRCSDETYITKENLWYCGDWEHQPMTTGGKAKWTEVETEDSYEGDGTVWQSGYIGNSASTYLETTVYGPVELKFAWKVSSEKGADLLEYYVDGESIAGISGEEDWEEVEYEIRTTGKHTIKWVYTKNKSYSDGDDCGWVDCIRFEGKNYSLRVYGGTGSGYYPAGETVTVKVAVPTGNTFKGWTTDDITLTSAQKKATTMTFTMPDEDVELIANFNVYSKLTVEGGKRQWQISCWRECYSEGDFGKGADFPGVGGRWH